MGSWDLRCIKVKVGKKQDVELVKQTMNCLNYYEAEALNELYEYGLDGPKWQKKGDETIIDYEDCDEIAVNKIYMLLAHMFEDVDLYAATAEGNNVSDYYSGKEYTYDSQNHVCVNREFDYCYGDGTAFGRRVKGGAANVDKAGSKVTRTDLDTSVKALCELWSIKDVEEYIYWAEKDKMDQVVVLLKGVIEEIQGSNK